MKKFPPITPLKMMILCVIASVSFSVKNCNAQSGFHVKPIPAQYQPPTDLLAPLRQRAATEKSTSYDLTKSLPQGYVTDGSVDYTTYLQQGINSNAKVVFPNFPVLVNHNGLVLKSNTTVVFDVNSKLILAPSDAANYQILRIYNVQNIKLFFPVVVGDRKDHTGTKGEWGMGISIAGATDIDIVNPVISDCWGDGIYIGRMPATSKNVRILCPVLNNNRRNGISIVSVDGLTIKKALVCNTNGTDPQCGIDFEPNGNADVLNDILLDEPVTFNNAKIGIAFSIWGVQGKVDNKTAVTITNHIDDGSDNAFFYNSFRNTRADNSMNGRIQVVHPTWKNNRISYGTMGHPEKGPNLIFSNVSIAKNSASQPDSVKRLRKNFGGAKVDFH